MISQIFSSIFYVFQSHVTSLHKIINSIFAITDQLQKGLSLGNPSHKLFSVYFSVSAGQFRKVMPTSVFTKGSDHHKHQVYVIQDME